MVSFSCDRCQDVVKKAKVENHFRSCGTRSVSCVDCCLTFGADVVRSHTMCMTEKEKYEGGGRGAGGVGAKKRPDFCEVCSLGLNGAVMAEQHYVSRKHKAAERKLKDVARTGEKQQNVGNGAAATDTDGKRPAATDTTAKWAAATNTDTPKSTSEAVQGSKVQPGAIKRKSVTSNDSKVTEATAETETRKKKKNGKPETSLDKSNSSQKGADAERSSAVRGSLGKEQRTDILRCTTKLMKKRETSRIKVEEIAKAVIRRQKRSGAPLMKTNVVVKQLKRLSKSESLIRIEDDFVILKA